MKGMLGLNSSDTPILKRDLDKDVIAEANKDGTIFLDKDVSKNSKLGKEAIAHEKVHLNQMKRGDLNYDDDFVYWKDKKYPRNKMKEGAHDLPWEKEAYNKTSNRRRRRNGKRRR